MIVNGKNMNFQHSITISNLLESLDLNLDKVVVEVNRDIISRDKYDKFFLKKEDIVEIINFVGGG